MSNIPAMLDHPVVHRGKFKRRLTTLFAAIAALALVSALILFTLASHIQQPGTGTGTHQQPGGTSNPRQVNSYTYHQAGTMPVYSLQWSADGTRIVSANENVTSWDAFSGSHMVSYTGTSAPRSQILFAQVSPDRTKIAVWDIGQIDVYEAATGKRLMTLIYPFTQTPGAKGFLPSLSPYISWSSDSKSIRALAGIPNSDGTRTNILVTFDLATGTHHDLQLSLAGLLAQIAWSPDGKYLAVGFTNADAVDVVNIANGQIVSNLHGNPPIESIPLGWSPDSSRLAAYITGDGTLYIWDAAKAHNILAHRGEGGTQPTWSPNGKYIAVINKAAVEILDVPTGKVIHTLTTPDVSGYQSVAWSPDGKAIAAGGLDIKGGVVSVWRVTF